MRSGLVALAAGAMALIAVAPLAAEAAATKVTVSIASGRPGGLYHPVAGAICRLVNEHTADHGVTCTVEFGTGSVTNIEAMRRGEVAMAMAQADTQRDALQGTGPFDDEAPFASMRAIASLFVEQVMIVARADRGIATFDDLKGKRVYLDTPGTGGRVLVQRLIAAKGWAPDAVTDVDRHFAPDLAEALCDGEFDAFSVTVGHPSPLIKEAADTCNVVLVPIVGPEVDRLVASDTLYAMTRVPAGMYRNNPAEVPGVGLLATLITTDAVPADTVEQITAALFAGLDRLREASLLFRSLTDRQMANDGLSAPLHEGAARHYEKAGLR